MKREIPLYIVLVLGVLMAIQPLIPHSYSQVFFEYMRNVLIIAMIPGAVLGVASIIRVHWPRVSHRSPGYFYSAVTLSCMLGMLLAGIIGNYTDPRSVFRFLYYNVQVPIESTMFALLAFFVASAAYRSFRARNVQATVLLAAAVIVMVGRTSLWGYIPFIGKYFPAWTNWLMFVPNLAAKRGIYLGMALGGLATSLKIILGIERSYLGSAGSSQ